MARNKGFRELRSGGEGASSFRSDGPAFSLPAGALGDPTGLGIRSVPAHRASATLLGSVRKCRPNECQRKRVNIPRSSASELGTHHSLGSYAERGNRPDPQQESFSAD